MTTYPFVQAKYYTKGGMTEPRAILWHMAEGAGTVSWLTHPNGDNSAHFVIETSGRIVQMVKLTDASHSAHVDIDLDDTDADDCGIYSEWVGKAVLGSGWSNINRYVVAVEVEGFRRLGPNADQDKAIKRLALDLQSQLPTLRGNLGHRDVQDYKSCPGCLFPWADIGGHGLFSQEEPVPPIHLAPLTYHALVVPKVGVPILAEPDNTSRVIRKTVAGDKFPRVGMDNTFHVIEAQDPTIGPFTAYIARGNVNADEPIAAPLPDCKAAVAAALAYVKGPAQAVITAIEEAGA